MFTFYIHMVLTLYKSEIMKKMNYLFSAVCVLIFSACTNESQSIEEDLLSTELRGRETQEQAYYLELDFNKVSLEYEYELLKTEILSLYEEIEEGNTEQHERLEVALKELAGVEKNLRCNEENAFRLPVLGGGPVPPPRCKERGSVIRPCPVILEGFDNFLVSTQEWKNDKASIDFFDKKNNHVGTMVGMSYVPESDGLLSKAEFEFGGKGGSPAKVIITNLDSTGALREYVYDIGNEEETYYLELDFNRVSLEYEYELLKTEILSLYEEIEEGNTEQHERLEVALKELAGVEKNLRCNEENAFRLPVLGGGPVPPPRCKERGSVIRPCPVILEGFDNFLVSTQEWKNDKASIDFFDKKNNHVGTMVGMSYVPESDGLLSKAEFEFGGKGGSPAKVIITNLDCTGKRREYAYDIKN